LPQAAQATTTTQATREQLDKQVAEQTLQLAAASEALESVKDIEGSAAQRRKNWQAIKRWEVLATTRLNKTKAALKALSDQQ
jgi:hypothetical protein